MSGLLNRERVIRAIEPEDLPTAWDQYYDRLSEYFLRLFPKKERLFALEVGCGRGQLTIPLAGRFPTEWRLTVMDSSTGPYRGSIGRLKRRLRTRRGLPSIQILEGDARNMSAIRDNTFDVILSNELLCDLLNRRDLFLAAKEFARTLRRRGRMIHGELSSMPENQPQRNMILADSPKATSTPS